MVDTTHTRARAHLAIPPFLFLPSTLMSSPSPFLDLSTFPPLCPHTHTHTHTDTHTHTHRHTHTLSSRIETVICSRCNRNDTSDNFCKAQHQHKQPLETCCRNAFALCPNTHARKTRTSSQTDEKWFRKLVVDLIKLLTYASVLL